MKALTPFILILISIGLYFVYISPTWTGIAEQKIKRDEYLNVVSKSEELRAKRDEVLATYNSISESDIARLNKLVPAKFNDVLFLNDLNAMATRYSLAVSNVKIDVPKDNANISNSSAPVVSVGTYKTITVTLSLKGDYAEFGRFLRELESSLQLMDVASLSVKSSGGSSSGSGVQKVSDNSYEYVMEIHTYALK